MTPVEVYQVLPGWTESYPRLLPSHPRNRHIDWVQLDDYAESGRPDPDRFDIFVKAGREFDTVWIAARNGYMFSDRLRQVLEPNIGGPADFRPMKVNGRPFWIMRLRHEIDALDLSRSEYDRSLDGGVKLLNKPVWFGDRITDPALFTIPQMRYTVWATSAVVRAYEESGCDGLLFGLRGEVAFDH